VRRYGKAERERLGRAIVGGGHGYPLDRTIDIGFGVAGTPTHHHRRHGHPDPERTRQRNGRQGGCGPRALAPDRTHGSGRRGLHIRIDNQDGPPEHHNVVVASGRTFPERIYQSANFNKGTFTFDVPALPAGNYLFICTVHADVMTGTLELR
jgi:hypothetical protein